MRVSTETKQKNHDLLMEVYKEYREIFGKNDEIESMITKYGRYSSKEFEEKIKYMRICIKKEK